MNYIDDNRVDGEFKDTAKWLEGDITTTLTLKGVFVFDLLAHHSLRTGMKWIRENKFWDKELVFSYQFNY